MSGFQANTDKTIMFPVHYVMISGATLVKKKFCSFCQKFKQEIKFWM